MNFNSPGKLYFQMSKETSKIIKIPNGEKLIFFHTAESNLDKVNLGDGLGADREKKLVSVTVIVWHFGRSYCHSYNFLLENT